MFEWLLQSDAALIIAIGAAADLGSRILLAIMSLFIQVKARYVYLTGAICTIASRFGRIISSDDFSKVQF